MANPSESAPRKRRGTSAENCKYCSRRWPPRSSLLFLCIGGCAHPSTLSARPAVAIDNAEWDRALGWGKGARISYTPTALLCYRCFHQRKNVFLGTRRQCAPSLVVSTLSPKYAATFYILSKPCATAFSSQVRRRSGEGRIFFLCSSDHLPFSRVPEPCEGRPVGVPPARDGLAGSGA